MLCLLDMFRFGKKKVISLASFLFCCCFRSSQFGTHASAETLWRSFCFFTKKKTRIHRNMKTTSFTFCALALFAVASSASCSPSSEEVAAKCAEKCAEALQPSCPEARREGEKVARSQCAPWSRKNANWGQACFQGFQGITIACTTSCKTGLSSAKQLKNLLQSDFKRACLSYENKNIFKQHLKSCRDGSKKGAAIFAARGIQFRSAVLEECNSGLDVDDTIPEPESEPEPEVEPEPEPKPVVQNLRTTAPEPAVEDETSTEAEPNAEIEVANDDVVDIDIVQEEELEAVEL